MTRSLFVAGVTLAALSGGAAGGHAQGSAVQTHGSCATAMGAAGVAAPCRDASAVLFNPAALALQPSMVGIGWTGISTSGSFTYHRTLEEVEREPSTASVPFGFASYRVNERLAAAIGVFAPYGLSSAWPEEFEGRYVSYDTSLRNIYIQPTVSFAATPWLSFGAGLDVVQASIGIKQYLDLATTATTTPGITFGQLGIPLNTPFVKVNLDGNGTGFTFNVGVLARLGEMASVGARYMHSARIDYSGDADFTRLNTGLVIPAGTGHPLNPAPNTQPLPLDLFLEQRLFAADGPLADQPISTTLQLPSQLVLGVAFQPVPSIQLLADYQRTGWQSFDQANIDFENQPEPTTLVLDYRDTNTYRFGAAFGISEALALRAGFIYNETAQKRFSVSPLLPEAERNHYTLGAGYDFGNGLGLDIGYQLVDQSDREGRVRGRAPGMTEAQLEALNVGVYEGDGQVFNITARYEFGPRGAEPVNPAAGATRRPAR